MITDKWATCEIDAKASPRNPYVVNFDKSENVESFEVVNRSASIGKSDFYLSAMLDENLHVKY